MVIQIALVIDSPGSFTQVNIFIVIIIIFTRVKFFMIIIIIIFTQVIIIIFTRAMIVNNSESSSQAVEVVGVGINLSGTVLTPPSPTSTNGIESDSRSSFQNRCNN